MTLLALDGNSIINRAYYGIRLLSTKDGIYTNGIYGFLNILLKIQNIVNPDAVAIAFDMRAPTFRHEMYDQYKAGRKGMPEELAMQMPILQELLQDLGYTIVKKEGYEADDILGTLADHCRKNGTKCVIATGDRDSFQLVGDGVTVYLTYTKGGQPQQDLVDKAYIEEKYGVTPKQLIDVKALMGDASDNIPGVKGIGEKTALALIQEHGSLDAIYEQFDDITLKPAVRKNLAAEKEIAYTSRTLATIDCCIPIDTDATHYIKQPPTNQKAYPLMAKLELFSLMERFEVSPSADPQPKTDLPQKELEIIFGELPAELLEQDSMDVLFDISDKTFAISALCVIVGHTYYYQQEHAENMASRILTSATPKRTNHLKSLWRWALLQGITLQNIVFDAEIAAYILNPNSTDYKLERLYGEYEVYPDRLEQAQQEAFPLLASSIGFTSLCDTLAQKITNNKQEPLLQQIELPLAEVLAHMEHVGIAVDNTGIAAFGHTLRADLHTVEAQIYELAQEKFNINSPKQLGVILFDKLGLPPKKKTKTGYSTNADVLDSLKYEHPIIDAILEYRQLAKLLSTYVDGLLAVVDPADGRIHTTFQQTLTRTGRISSTEPNLQNIPIRTELGSELRRFFIAKPENLLVDADYSQIELRVLADLADDTNMKKAFAEHTDIHTQTASQVMDLPPEYITPIMRSHAKAVNFGIVYGIGAFSLSQDIGVTVHQADEYIKNYLDYYSGVKQYMEDVIDKAKENGYVTTLFGRRRYLPELGSSNHNMREFGKRVARNMPIQGTAADIIKIAMIRVHKRLQAEGLTANLILQVHDELIIECLPTEQEQVQKLLKEEMEQAGKPMTVPLEVDIHFGTNWLEAH